MTNYKPAIKAGTNVVLIDTAGRMQDNTPLMAALAKLVAVNKPDLTLFVGEVPPPHPHLATAAAALPPPPS